MATGRKSTNQERAWSSLGYLFLRDVFGKENYSESVLEELQWVAENLATENPEQLLVDGIREELREGEYVNINAAEFSKVGNVENAFKQVDISLSFDFGMDKDERETIISRLRKIWDEVQTTDNQKGDNQNVYE